MKESSYEEMKTLLLFGKLKDSFKSFKGEFSSFLSLIMVRGAHILGKALAVGIMVIIIPCFIKSSECFAAQVQPKLINSKLVSVESVTEGFVNHYCIRLSENNKFFLKSLSEFFGRLHFIQIPVEGIHEKGRKKNPKNSDEHQVDHGNCPSNSLGFLWGFLICLIIHGAYYFYRVLSHKD